MSLFRPIGIAFALCLSAAPAAQAENIYRTSVAQNGVFTPVARILSGPFAGIYPMGSAGLTRSILFDSDALLLWAQGLTGDETLVVLELVAPSENASTPDSGGGDGVPDEQFTCDAGLSSADCACQENPNSAACQPVELACATADCDCEGDECLPDIVVEVDPGLLEEEDDSGDVEIVKDPSGDDGETDPDVAAIITIDLPVGDTPVGDTPADDTPVSDEAPDASAPAEEAPPAEQPSEGGVLSEAPAE